MNRGDIELRLFWLHQTKQYFCWHNDHAYQGYQILMGTGQSICSFQIVVPWRSTWPLSQPCYCSHSDCNPSSAQKEHCLAMQIPVAENWGRIEGYNKLTKAYENESYNFRRLMIFDLFTNAFKAPALLWCWNPGPTEYLRCSLVW